MNNAAATATRTATGYDLVFPDGTRQAIRTGVAYTHAVIIFGEAWLHEERRMSDGPVWHLASEHKTEKAARAKRFYGPVAASKTIVAITD